MPKGCAVLIASDAKKDGAEDIQVTPHNLCSYCAYATEHELGVRIISDVESGDGFMHSFLGGYI